MHVFQTNLYFEYFFTIVSVFCSNPWDIDSSKLSIFHVPRNSSTLKHPEGLVFLRCTRLAKTLSIRRSKKHNDYIAYENFNTFEDLKNAFISSIRQELKKAKKDESLKTICNKCLVLQRKILFSNWGLDYTEKSIHMPYTKKHPSFSGCRFSYLGIV